MPQVLKDEVEQRIRAAALAIFSRKGYAAATMAEVARKAGISAGNIYRYFPGKKALLAAVVPDSLGRRLVELVQRRMEAARGQPDLDAVAPGSGYAIAARAPVDLALEHREEAIFLLSRATGTPYAELPEKLVRLLVEEALQYVRTTRPGVSITDTLLFDLEQIYRNYVRAWTRILERYTDPEEARQAITAYERYHLAGLRALFS